LHSISASLDPLIFPGAAQKSRHHPLGGKKTLQCPWASKKTKKTLVIGVDIGLEDSFSMALCNLVGMLSYRYLFTTKLDDWMINTLQPLMGYIPSLSYLGCGWLHF